MAEESISLLNKAAADELAAVHQYMYFHFHCDDQGYDLLASLFKKTAIEEMIHIERAAERILFLEGDVELKAAEDVQPIREVRAMLERAAAMEKQSAREYNEWAVQCSSHADSATRKIFEDLVADEERHYDQFMTEMENMDRFGENYLALQSIERSRSMSHREEAAE
jgi:bacterioferritin